MDKKKIQIRPVGFGIYIGICLCLLLMFLFFRSYLCLILIVLWICTGGVSLWNLMRVVSNVEMRIVMEPTCTKKKEAICSKLVIENAWYVGLLDCRWHLRIGNRLVDVEEHLTVELPVPFKGKFVMQLPLRCDDVGEMYVDVNRVVFQDFLGMYKVQMHEELSAYCSVMPLDGENEGKVWEQMPRGQEMWQESTMKGTEEQQIGQIREYRQGDLLRDIHWKLSAKQRELMVKERMSSAGSEIVIVQSFSMNKTENELLISVGYQGVCQLVKKSVPVRLLAWNNKLGEYEEFACCSLEQTEEVYGQLFHLPVKQRMGEDKDMIFADPSILNFYSVEANEGQAEMEIHSNG